jgi:hypothetical protein
VSGLEYLRSCKELVEQGLYVELGAYRCHVFLDFREVRNDAINQYAYLADFLAGRAVPSIGETMKELFLQPLHYPFKALVNADLFGRLIAAVATTDDRRPTPALPLNELGNRGAEGTDDRRPTTDDSQAMADAGQESVISGPLSVVDLALLDEIEQKMLNLLREIKRFTGSTGDEAPIAREVRDEMAIILRLPALEQRFGLAAPGELADQTASWGSLFGWAFVHALGKISGAADYAGESRSWIDEWRLGRIIDGVLRELGVEEYAAGQAIMVLKHMTSYQDWFASPELQQPQALVETLLADSEIQQLLRVNRYQNVLWFDKLAFEQLLAWLLRVATIVISADAERTPAAPVAIEACAATMQQLQEAAAASDYQVERLREVVQG